MEDGMNTRALTGLRTTALGCDVEIRPAPSETSAEEGENV
jgi:hypothetical protein